MELYDNRNPKCRKSYITYMDILGYTNMILEGSKENLLNVFNAIKNSKSMLNSTDMNIETDVIVKMFSDNIIAAIPLTVKNEENMFYKFRHIYQVSRFQFSLCLYGFFVRGSFVIDDLYIDNDIIFGKGILKAYNLEEKVAVFPRIIVDDNTYNELNDSDSIIPINKCIKKDSDGIWYIDFLNVLYTSEVVLSGYYDEYYEKLREIFWEQIIKLQDVVLNKLDIYKTNSKIQSKYKWFATYLKDFCNKNYPDKEFVLF